MKLSSTLSSYILKTFSDGDSTMSLGRLFQQMIIFIVKNVLCQYVLCQDENSPSATCTHCPLSSPSGSL